MSDQIYDSNWPALWADNDTGILCVPAKVGCCASRATIRYLRGLVDRLRDDSVFLAQTCEKACVCSSAGCKTLAQFKTMLIHANAVEAIVDRMEQEIRMGSYSGSPATR